MLDKNFFIDIIKQCTLYLMRTQWHCFFGGIFMSKFDKRKIAVALAFASLGSKTLAMSSNKNQVKSLQTLGAVGGGGL